MLRFLRSQIVAGILSVMFLPRRMIPVTVLLAHSISSQSQGEDEEFQDWMDGGLPHCRLRFSSEALSVLWDCEFTWRGVGMRMRSRRRNGVLRNETGSMDILVGSVGYSG